MGERYLHDIAILRLLVGYLGERKQLGWWDSSFLGAESVAFLSPVFNRSYTLAQSHGVTAAACAVHDERIGLGRVYHLFRLPEDVEVQLQHVFSSDAVFDEIKEALKSRETALAKLREYAEKKIETVVGPTVAGDRAAIRDSQSWAKVAALYQSGFERQIEVYPYFGGD